jgi:hypothetical protein
LASLLQCLKEIRQKNSAIIKNRCWSCRGENPLPSSSQSPV